MNAVDIITKAKIQLLLSQPFFGTLVTHLETREANASECAFVEQTLGQEMTMAVDGRTLVYSPAFVESLKIEEVKAVLAHEVLHCSLLHHLRRGSRDSAKWNHATDYAINLILEECNKEASGSGKAEPFPLPKGCLLDPQWAGMGAEEIYARLPDPPKGGKGKRNQPGGTSGQQGQPGGGQGQPGAVLDSPSGKPEDQDKDKSRWEMATTQAGQCAKMRGTVPAYVKRLLDERMKTVVPWQSILREFVTRKAKDDYSLRRQKAHIEPIDPDIITPALYSERCGPLGVFVDNSGSCWDFIPAFMSEVQAILDEVRPESLHVLVADSEVKDAWEYEPGDIITDEIKGGGGTDFRPPFDYAHKHGLELEAVIYLTDLYGEFPTVSPWPTLWVTPTHDRAAPIGETVYMGTP